ncbi:hypothetical protein ES705_28231 [subsurface metagenome]
MVKIVNPLGQVKTGVQGEAVYQGKYGQQIRRTRQPKRAIPSQKQLEHRQLYREALVWRKGLSLPNRRYLDGYCIANWIVDGYKMPLPWSRFALKLYLEHVQFVPSLVTTEVVGEEAVDQEYTTGDTSYFNPHDTTWSAQTFTPSITGKIIKVKLKLFRNLDSAEYIIKITTTDEGGYPTDTVLCSTTFNSEPITTESPGEWYEFTFYVPATLTMGIVYAIVIHGVPGLPNPRVYWRVDPTAPTYYEGCVYNSINSGSSWTRHLYDDLMFQTFMLMPGYKFTHGTLAVKHPALLSGEHRRDGKLVDEWTNLSNLDEEYLTGQVGVDVFSGDALKFTTIAGLEYSFRVP